MRQRRVVIDGKQECIGCHQWLPLESFCRHKPSSTGRNWRCKECHKKTTFGGLTPSQRAKQWQLNNPERYKQLNTESRQRIIHDLNRLRKRRALGLKYYHTKKEQFRASRNQWKRNNPWHGVADRCRSLVRMTMLSFLPGGPKFKSLTSCDGDFFRNHIQSKWLPGMNWGNFGRGGWTIGHIIPCAHYNTSLLTPEGLQACFHYSNLQPEWERSNLAKFTSDPLTPAQIALLPKTP